MKSETHNLYFSRRRSLRFTKSTIHLYRISSQVWTQCWHLLRCVIIRRADISYVSWDELKKSFNQNVRACSSDCKSVVVFLWRTAVKRWECLFFGLKRCNRLQNMQKTWTRELTQNTGGKVYHSNRLFLFLKIRTERKLLEVLSE